MADAAEDPKAARLLRKQKEADWRKTAKQLKAKDVTTKLAAIEKCRGDDSNYEPLLEGDCLGPLMQLLVAKKKNTPIVEAAVAVVLSFASADASGDGAPMAHAKRVIEQGTKKKPKTTGGKLFSDLAPHDESAIATTAMQTLELLVKAARATEKAAAEAAAAGSEATEKEAAALRAATAMQREQLMRGAPLECLAKMVVKCAAKIQALKKAYAASLEPPPADAPPAAEGAEPPDPVADPTEAIETMASALLTPALSALSFFLAVGGAGACSTFSRHPGACGALAEVSLLVTSLSCCHAARVARARGDEGEKKVLEDRSNRSNQSDDAAHHKDRSLSPRHHKT